MSGRLILPALLVATGLSACTGMSQVPMAPLKVTVKEDVGKDYLIGPGDKFQVFVWQSPDLSVTVPVRPDGRISVPLIDDLAVSGKTPSEVSRDLEGKLAEYIKDAKVTVIMVDFIGPMARQVRIVGEAAKPQSLGYRRGMTILDVMIAAGGLTPFASGNRATISRVVNSQPTTYGLRLDDLIKSGDVTANIEVAPGDIVMIPQSWF